MIDSERRASQPRYCLFINTLFEGELPIYRDSDGFPVVHESLREAQNELADIIVDRILEYLDGQREFEDAMTIEEYITLVDLHPDGSISDEMGRHYGPI